MKPENVLIQNAEARLAYAQRDLNDTIKKVQDECSHEKVGETGGSMDAEGRILRVCLICGLGTANAYGNYGVLGDKTRLVYKLTNQHAVALRRTHGR